MPAAWSSSPRWQALSRWKCALTAPVPSSISSERSPAWIEAETEVRRPPRDGHEAQVRAPARVGREAGDGRVVRARAAEDDGQGLRATESLGVHDHPRAALRHPRVQLTRGRRAVAVGEAPVELERASGLRGERRTQN